MQLMWKMAQVWMSKIVVQKDTAINIWGTIYIVMRGQEKGKIPLAVKNDQIPHQKSVSLIRVPSTKILFPSNKSFDPPIVTWNRLKNSRKRSLKF